MVHDVRPPWWQMLLTLVLGVFGAVAVVSAERYLRIESRSGGLLHRHTTGEVPRGWPRRRPWEVPDGTVVEPPGQYRWAHSADPTQS